MEQVSHLEELNDELITAGHMANGKSHHYAQVLEGISKSET